MNMYDSDYGGGRLKARILRHKPLLFFWAVYSLAFWLAALTAAYTLPILVALITAVIMKPLYDFLRRRFRFQPAFTATVLTLMVYGALLLMVGFLLYLIAVQAVSLVQNYSDLIEKHLNATALFDQLREGLMTGSLFNMMSDAAGLVFRVIPMVITFVIFAFVLTIFLLNHLSALKAGLLQRIGTARRATVDRVLTIGYGMVRRFIRSYLILYGITFVEAAFIFWLTGVPYPLAFAFITAVADILPILGPGTVYVPFAVMFILQRNYLGGVTLLVFFLLTSVLRQILEPKIVSDTVKVHPLAIMAAIYFSIVAMNIWILFYVILLFLVYKVLVQAGVLPKKSPSAESSPAPAATAEKPVKQPLDDCPT